MSFSIVSLNLAGLALSTFFYGIYFVLFFISMYLLMRRSQTGESIYRTAVFNSALLLFILITSHWIMILARIFLAFQEERNAELFLADSRQSTALAQNTIVVFCTLIGDSLIIHRLWVVWSGSKLVLIFPVVSLLGLTVDSFVSDYVNWRYADVFANPSLKVGAVLTLLTNVYCTALITWRIWAVTRRSMPVGGTNLMHFLVIWIESTAFHAFWAILFFVLYQAESEFQYIVIEAVPEVVGFVNTLIHTRVGLGWTSEQMQMTDSPGGFSAKAKSLAGSEV
ncbi:hypothetical protein FB45DRAFT_935232 [Roridomyces roridus]|uniref:Uncharacterized protein n=1 Tax=Roridomyces roridus TaxID=1738132 RepID=A0AAD7BB51_9AGAR|nr:hypothetical protein FB45DRAFT_935232 [Roridomyces roridus]